MNRDTQNGRWTVVKIAAIATIAGVLISSTMGFLGGVFAFDRSVDTKIRRAVDQVKDDVIHPIIQRMDRMDERQVRTNQLLEKLLLKGK